MGCENSGTPTKEKPNERVRPLPLLGGWDAKTPGPQQRRSQMSESDPFHALVDVMRKLRDPNEGCPWDLEQSHQSLKPYLIEEAYEVLDAIEDGDPANLCEELGDVLLQIVFHAQLGKEAGTFDINDVSQGIVDKMVRRHPHVFQSGAQTTKASREEIRVDWEIQKAAEGKRALSGVPRNLPALLRAVRVTEKASRVGFDWKYAEDVLDKVIEEAHELKEALRQKKAEEIEAELGDLLFSLANFGRHIQVDAEDALRKTIDRFTRRFEWVESRLMERGEPMGSTPVDTLNHLWEEAKKEVG